MCPLRFIERRYIHTESNMKKKRPKAIAPEKYSGTIQVTLPCRLIGYVTQVAEFSETDIQTVIKVMVAAKVIADRGGSSASG